MDLTLISFATCPYVQRAVIALKEKGVAHEVVYVDLADKPAWFLAISPLGKVPVLQVEPVGQPPVHIFESAVILEYLEEAAPDRSFTRSILWNARSTAPTSKLPRRCSPTIGS